MKATNRTSYKNILVLFLIGGVAFSALAQKDVQTIDYVRTAQFGKETVYYQENDEVLNGAFKIAERSGAYSEATFIDGKVDGKWLGYDSSGRLEYFSTFANGIGNGPGESYDEEGNVLNTYGFKNGEEHGEWIYRTDKGIYQTENYNEGAKEGKWTDTSKNYNGSVTGTTTKFYKNDQPTGTWESKTGTGEKIWTKTYTGPKTYSEIKYSQNGFKKNETAYEKGVKTMEKKYHDNGKLAFSATYNARGPIGTTKRFNKKGKKTRSTPYKNGRLNGIDSTYHSQNGNIYVEREYKDGIENGIYKEYYYNGELYLSGQRIKGQREGKWTQYGNDGKVKRERVYDSDNQISDTKYD